MSTSTVPGSVTLSLSANASSVTIVDMANPEREYGAPGAPAPARAKRKYTRRHFDKQRHEAHEDKERSDGEAADEQS